MDKKAPQSDGPILPSNPAAERAVLGGVLMDNTYLPIVAEQVRPEDFFIMPHVHIFNCMVAMAQQSRPIDLLTLTETLRREGDLETVGGYAYVASLTDGLPRIQNIAEHARIVRETAMLRRVVHAGHAIQQAAVDREPTSEIMEHAQRILTVLSESTLRRGLVGIREIAQQASVQIETIISGGRAITGVATGFGQLDNLLTGLHPSELIVLAARPGVGKAQPLTANVLTPSGYVQFGSLAVGSEIIGCDGLCGLVTGIFHQGLKEVYRVTFSDGTSTECCADHLWFTTTRNERRCRQGSGSVKPLRDIVSTIKRRDTNGPNHAIPVVQPVHFKITDKPRPLKPRLLGLLLGDGDFTNGCVRFYKPENDLLREVEKLLPCEDATSPLLEGVRIRRAQRNNEISATRAGLEALGLYGLETTEKFVPEQYIFTDLASRMDLLSGLFDTDGSVTQGGPAIEYSTSSPQLARDVCFMARSLGAIVSIDSRIPIFKYKGETKKGLESFRMVIHFPSNVVPVRSKKNTAKWRTVKQSQHKSIVDITSVGSKECVCISVNTPGGLYVTDDFIVTHNTALALNMAEAVAVDNHKPVAIFSLEMSAVSLVMRLATAMARQDAQKLRTGYVSQDELHTLTEALGWLSAAPLWIDDSSSSTVTDIAVRSQRLKRESGLSLVIVDYIQLLSSSKRHANRQEEVADISRQLKALAKDLDVPILALSQLTRAPEQEGRKPQLSDLRNSGAIEQDADVVLFIHRPHMHKKKGKATEEERAETELIVAKQRNGPTDSVALVFIGKFTRFAEAAVPWESMESGESGEEHDDETQN